MRAKLISVEQPPGYSFKLYNCECVKCGKIYKKYVYNKRTTPYCLDCIKERDRKHQKEWAKKKQQERTNEVLDKIRAEIEELEQELYPSDYRESEVFEMVLDIINKHIGDTHE